MFNKKILMMLLLFIVSISAVSAASASEDIDDADFDDTATLLSEDLSAAIGENDESLDDGDEDMLASQDEDALGVGIGISSSQYTIDLNDDGYTVSPNGGTLTYYMDPYKAYGYNNYNFYFSVVSIDAYGNEDVAMRTSVISSTTDSATGNHQYTLKPTSPLAPGLYRLEAVNNLDLALMDATVLKVSGNAVISASDYNSDYNSGVPMTVKVTDRDTNKPLKNVIVHVAYSNGKTYEDLTDEQGQITFIPNVNAGSYTATISLSSIFSHINAAAVKKTVTVKKSPVSVTAKDVSAYKGSKITLEASVTSNGKNVNDGKVVFKINGKEYSADVKNGRATKEIDLSEVKSYEYTATYVSNNYEKANPATSTATLKNKIATKITVKKHITAYRGSPKAFTVKIKTASGKAVKGGKVKIIDTVKVNSKGKAKFYANHNGNFIKQVGNVAYFKKVSTKTFTVKYKPSSDAYKPATAKMKITVIYKCTACGKKTSHSHNGMTFIVK